MIRLYFFGVRSRTDQARHHYAVINNWTILGMWDRTGDKRGASNASFLASGIHTEQEMQDLAKGAFPELWRRIHV